MNDFHARMQQLQAEYRQTVTADICRLREQAERLRGDEQDRALLEQLLAVLHRLAGGSGAVDLQQLSAQCRGLELDLNEWLESPLADAYRAALAEFRLALQSLSVN